jgi:hypothetical protein
MELAESGIEASFTPDYVDLHPGYKIKIKGGDAKVFLMLLNSSLG